MLSTRGQCSGLLQTLLTFTLFAKNPIRCPSRKFRMSGCLESPRYLGQDEAIRLDEELFKDYKFSLLQLMELAGLAVATAVTEVYKERKASPVLVVCGPGNNGGDGIVAARHLKQFGFANVQLLLSRAPSKAPFPDLLHQAIQNEVKVSYDPNAFSGKTFGLVVDGLFGFSYKPPLRPEYAPLLSLITTREGNTPVASIDIPSGWDVEGGPPKDPTQQFMPNLLISLTAPKKCARHFTGEHHFVGGRFVPPGLAAKFSLNLPEYEGTNQILRLK